MNLEPELNLDYLAAKHAQEIVKSLSAEPKKTENSLTKTMGVLQENGVYACFLYLLAREKDASNVVIPQMRALLKALGIENDSQDNLKYAQYLTADLHRLLLAKEALEQMLIYARYGAKAAEKSAEKAGGAA